VMLPTLSLTLIAIVPLLPVVKLLAHRLPLLKLYALHVVSPDSLSVAVTVIVMLPLVRVAGDLVMFVISGPVVSIFAVGEVQVLLLPAVSKIVTVQV